MRKFLKLLRVEQWVKNLFVFTPLFFSGNVTHVDLTLKSIFAFLVFSFTASSIYILNDYTDIESDKKHPEKCNRPLASGAISKTAAKIIFVLLILSVVLLVFFGGDYFHKNFIYNIMSVQAVSNTIGVIEIIIALLLIFSVKFAFLRRYAGIGMIITFLITLSYLFTTPGVWKTVDGIPVTDFFILKDLMLLGFGLMILQKK